MAGVDVGGTAGKRRSLDSEINMIPMIDLLMVTISFLLVTAVWTHMARINADAQVPGPTRLDVDPSLAPEKILHVYMTSDDTFVLAWKQGSTTVDSFDVSRRDEMAQGTGARATRFPDLASKIASEWKAKGQHANLRDQKLDQAVLHTNNRTDFGSIVAVLDAIHAPQRAMTVGAKTEKVPAFNVVFAVD